MGCVTDKENQIANPCQVGLRNKKLDDLVYQPLFSSLYNMLRKRNDIEIFRASSSGQPLFQFESDPSLLSKGHDIKMLCNFKNVLIVGQLSMASEIKRNCTPKAIYVLSASEAKRFLQIFPIFKSSEPKLQTKYMPLVAFIQQELTCNKDNKQSKIILLHSQKYKNQSLYEKLGIDQVVTSPVEDTDDLISRLGQGSFRRVLYLHPPETKQQELLGVLSIFLKRCYSISSNHSRAYLETILPQTRHQQFQAVPKSEALIGNPSKMSNPERTMTQILESTLFQLHKEMGDDEAAGVKLQRSYNLVVNLISNIYSNKESDNFRRVRKTNKQINDCLGRYKSGGRLLEEVGFLDEGAFYINNTDIKYLKLYRTDLDVAYKKFNDRRAG